MVYTIKNSFLTVKVLQKGAEICSIMSNITGKEFMWGANPDVWASYAPVLFPVIGSLKNNSTKIGDGHFMLPKHGIIRNNTNIELKYQDLDIVMLKLTANNSTLKVYPFMFEFVISFQLIGNKLIVAHKVTNIDNKTMFFAIGGHPAFNCHVDSNICYNDYYIEFDCDEDAYTYNLGRDGLLNGTRTKIFEQSNQLPLSVNMFANDALIFKSLKSKTASLRNRVNSDAVIVNFAGFPYLGIWAKPGANFVCIEPWQGITDSFDSNGIFETKEAIVELPANETYRVQYSIEIEE